MGILLSPQTDHKNKQGERMLHFLLARLMPKASQTMELRTLRCSLRWGGQWTIATQNTTLCESAERGKTIQFLNSSLFVCFCWGQRVSSVPCAAPSTREPLACVGLLGPAGIQIIMPRVLAYLPCSCPKFPGSLGTYKEKTGICFLSSLLRRSLPP